MDIDGTVTKSNVQGYFQTVFLGVFSYIHKGIAEFLTKLNSIPYQFNIMYLTSRPITHINETRRLLSGIKQGNDQVMPDGPLFVNRESISKALYREVITKNTIEYKSQVLIKIAQCFKSAGSLYRSPYVLGIGNTENDAHSYNIAGLVNLFHMFCMHVDNMCAYVCMYISKSGFICMHVFKYVCI